MYRVSDWAILNDTKSKQLERILSEFHHLGESEIYQACILLESYHAVYRRNRLEQRRNQLASGQAKLNESCQPPTPTQLQEIARRVNAKAALSLATEEVVTQLRDLATRLREYRRYVRASLRGTAFLDELNHRPKRDRNQSDGSSHNGYIPLLQMYPI